MKLIDYLKDYQTSNPQWDKLAILDILRKAKRNLMTRIAHEANGNSEAVSKIMPVIKESFGE